LGWTAIFKISALLTSGLIILLSFQLPKRQPSATGGYLQMLKTLVHLFRHEALLRRRAFYQACLFGSFSLFWTVMPMWLADQYHFTQRGIAVFALVGVSGAIAAPIAGRLADRGYARHVTRAAFLTALSAMLMTCLPLKNTAVMLLLLVLAAVLLDMAVTGNLIVGQQIIFSLGDAIRGRVNGLFMAAFFLGGAFGSSMGSALYAYGGWPAAALLAIALPCLALVYDLLTNS
jgi:predicted MFS family arabinose efflux permease